MWGTFQLKYPLAFAIADKLNYALLLLLSVLVVMVYHPVMIGMTGAETVLHGIIAFVFVLLFLLSQVDKPVFSSGMINAAWILFGIAALMALLMYALYGDTSMKGELRNIAIPLCALMIGWQMKMDEKKLIGLILTFSFSIIIVGISLIFIQGSGFRITETYFMEQKNAVGPLIATAAVLCTGMALSASGKRKFLWVLTGIVLALFCVVLVLTIRARAALLAMALVMALMVFQRYRSNYLLLSLIGALLIASVVFLLLPYSIKQYAYQSLFSGFTGGDITSGRMVRNQQAMQLLAETPLFGQVFNDRQLATVHNYPLMLLCKYGLLFSAPLLLLYISLLYADLRTVVKKGICCMHSVGAYALLIVFVVSMFEYSFPYGPGTATVLNFIVFGFALKIPMQQKEELHNNDYIVG